MDDLVRWLGAQLDADERIARAAVGRATADWYASPVLASGSKLVTIRDRRDNRPMARLEDCDVQDEEPLFTAIDVGAHIAEWDPARVLREIDAKRQVLAECEQAARYARTTWGQSNADQSRARTLGKVVRLLALPYADRPGYLEEWKP